MKSNPAYQPALAELYFEPTLNNWRLIVGDQQPHHEVVLSSINSRECIGIDYRLEFSLSTIAKKKVMKPVIALILVMKNGKLVLYFNMDQFAKLRYRVAEALKTVYSIEMKTLF